jgi:hypothetical protein
VLALKEGMRRVKIKIKGFVGEGSPWFKIKCQINS